MADTPKMSDSAPATPTTGEQPKVKGPDQDMVIRGQPGAARDEHAFIEFDEKSQTWAILCDGLAAARYGTQTEAESNLHRFQPNQPRSRKN